MSAPFSSSPRGSRSRSPAPASRRSSPLRRRPAARDPRRPPHRLRPRSLGHPRVGRLQTVRDALLRHPSEPYIPFIGGVDASRRGKSVLPWVERAFALAPVYGPAHFILAQQLAQSGPAQARLEYRMAIVEDNALLHSAITQGAALVASYDDAMELVPEDPKDHLLRITVLDELAQNIARRLPATRERIDELIVKLDPLARGPLDRVVSNTIIDLGQGGAAPWCRERRACVQRGLTAVNRLIVLDPGSCAPIIARARLEVAGDDVPSGLHHLQDGAQSATDPIVCWQALGEMAYSARNDVYLTSAEEALSRTGCTVDSECAGYLLWIAELEQRRGNTRRDLANRPLDVRHIPVTGRPVFTRYSRQP